MLFIPPTMPSVYETNLSVSDQRGTTVTASASANTKGSYSSLIDPTSQPSYGIWLGISDIQASGASADMLVDIAYGPTGGGSEQVIIPNVNAGGAILLNSATWGKLFYFPVYIPTGTRVSARCQDPVGSDTCLVQIWLGQDPLYAPLRGKITDYGAVIASSRGTLVTPASNSFGSWTQLSAGMDHAHRFWAVATDTGGDSTISSTGKGWFLELGIGPDSGNVTAIAGPFVVRMTTSEAVGGAFPFIQYGETVESELLWCRASSGDSGDTEARGVIAYGMD